LPDLPGDDRPGNVAQWAQHYRVQIPDYRLLCRSPEAVELVGGEIERVHVQFKQYRLLENKLGVEDAQHDRPEVSND
jgi:hypothetical protein